MLTNAHACAHLSAFRLEGSPIRSSYTLGCSPDASLIHERLASVSMDSRSIRHGYSLSAAHYESKVCPLAFHLRPQRQWYGEHGITQRDLAQVAGVSLRFITFLENACDLQVSIEAVMRVAFALGCPVEAIVAPQRVAAIKEEIERAKAELAKRRRRSRRI